MPKDEELRAEVIQLHYDVLAAGHRGRWKTVELVAGSDKGCWKVCEGMRSISENKE